MTTLVDVCKSIQLLTEGVSSTYQIKRVDYGDVDRVTESIQVCVDPEFKRTELRTIGNRGVTRIFRVNVVVYFSFITNPSYNREYCDRLAEQLESIYNADPTLGGKVMNGLVTEVGSGYARKDGITVRANRLLYEASAISHIA